MLELARETESHVSGGSIRTATVETIAEDGRRARVTMEESAGEGEAIWAEVAVPGTPGPTPGARVLLAIQDTGEPFVIAVLGGGASRERRIELAGGASVRVTGTPEAERLELFSEGDRLLLEYDTATGKLALNAPSGDLALVSAEGDIILDAARTVRVSGHAVEATGSSHVHLGATGPGGTTNSLLRLDPSSARIASPHLGVTSRSGTVHVEEARYRGGRLAARIDHLELVARRIERVVGQVHESVERVYTTVKELLEVRAQRVRTLVERTYQLTVKRAFLRSEDDFKIKGETIHLG